MYEWEERVPAEVRERLRGIIGSSFAQFMGIELIDISPQEEVRVSMDTTGKGNSLGVAHGGTIFALADQAFAIAGNLGTEYQVAISANITYVRPGRGRLDALARKVCETKRTSVYEAKVFEGEELIAVFQGTGYKLRQNK